MAGLRVCPVLPGQRWPKHMLPFTAFLDFSAGWLLLSLLVSEPWPELSGAAPKSTSLSTQVENHLDV